MIIIWTTAVNKVPYYRTLKVEPVLQIGSFFFYSYIRYQEQIKSRKIIPRRQLLAPVADITIVNEVHVTPRRECDKRFISFVRQYNPAYQ